MSKLKEEELIALARLAPPVEPEPDYASRKKKASINDDIDDFIEFTELEKGTKQVPPSEIYRLYCEWSSDPVTVPQFKRYFNKLHPISIRYERETHYLNKSITAIEELINEKE